MKVQKILVATLTVGVAAFSCGKKKKDEETTTGVSDKIQVSNVGELKLSNAINVSLPASMQKSSSSSLALALGDKSSAACQVGYKVDSGMRMLKQSIGGMFCHFEKEDTFGQPITIADGRIYKIAIKDTAGSQNMLLKFALKSTGGLTIYMCSKGTGSDYTLDEQIDIDEAKDGKAKGSASMIHSESDGGKYSFSAKFDAKMTDKDKIKAIIKMKYANASNGEGYQQFMSLDLNEVAGTLQKVHIAEKGTFGGQTFSNAGIAMQKGDYGVARFAYNHGQYGIGGNQDYVDKNGKLIASTASADYAGDMLTADSSIPAFPTDLSPTAPSGYDCSTTGAIDLTIDMDDAVTKNAAGQTRAQAHDSCDNNSWDDRNCWTGYEYGEHFTPDTTKFKALSAVESALGL